MPLLALEADSKNSRNSAGDSIMVYYDLTGDSLGTNCDVNWQQVVFRSLETMEQGKQQIQLNKEVVEFLNDRIRKQTSWVYDLSWQRWEAWYKL